MAGTSSSTKNWGLRLVQPGAPEGVLHHIVIDGVPGLYSTDKPTPVGGENEPSLEAARAVAKSDDAPVKLEEIGPRKVEQLREEQPTTIDEQTGPAGEED